MDIPIDLRYTKEHEWVRLEGDIATIGITDYAQSELGDIVFVELPGEGDKITQMEPCGTIEAVKAVSELFSPVTGKVIEVNSALDDDPMAINRDPYGDGWMIKAEVTDTAQIEEILDSVGYRNIISQ